MNKCAPEEGGLASHAPLGLSLRSAQRAFAAAFDAENRVGEFRGAQLRSAARRTLSALSADDRAVLATWLALLLAARASAGGERLLGFVARIDQGLVARVGRELPLRIEALAIRGGPDHIVAA
jgi:hypothetical protein